MISKRAGQKTRTYICDMMKMEQIDNWSQQFYKIQAFLIYPAQNPPLAMLCVSMSNINSLCSTSKRSWKQELL